MGLTEISDPPPENGSERKREFPSLDENLHFLKKKSGLFWAIFYNVLKVCGTFTKNISDAQNLEVFSTEV